jgi:hypothetical protein
VILKIKSVVFSRNIVFGVLESFFCEPGVHGCEIIFGYFMNFGAGLDHARKV